MSESSYKMRLRKKLEQPQFNRLSRHFFVSQLTLDRGIVLWFTIRPMVMLYHICLFTPSAKKGISLMSLSLGSIQFHGHFVSEAVLT